MKTATTILFALFISVTTFAQTMFVHTATAGNIDLDASFIDHPDLNNNPNAQLLISHNWNPVGSTGVLNNNVTGVFYSAIENKWSVFNENSSAMIEGSSYNIYIDQGSDITLHIADAANQGSTSNYSIISHPDLNNNPDVQIILTTYYNPNSKRNDHNYGVWYSTSTGRWIIFTEDVTATIPLDSAFFVGTKGTATQTITHTANAGNIAGNWTQIDHPILNGNPNAVFVFTHNWGAIGDSSNVVFDETLGAFYDGAIWAIYTEDAITPIPENIEFDIIILDPLLGVTDSSIEEFSIYPNPANNQLTISSKEEVTAVSIYNILGQEVATYAGSNIQMNIDISFLSTGTYIAKIQVGDAISSKRFIKL